MIDEYHCKVYHHSPFIVRAKTEGLASAKCRTYLCNNIAVKTNRDDGNGPECDHRILACETEVVKHESQNRKIVKQRWLTLSGLETGES